MIAPPPAGAIRTSLLVVLLIGALQAASPSDARAATEEPTYASPAHAFAIGQLLAAEGELVEAAAALSQAAEATEDPYVLVEYAEVLARIRRGRKAIELAHRARDLAPEDPEILTSVARLFLSGAAGPGPPDEATLRTAAELLEEALSIEPTDPESLHALGRIYQELGEPEAAARSFRAIVERHPDARAASSLLLQTLLEEGERDEAVALLRRRLERRPESVEMWQTLVDLLVEAGEPTTAVRELERAPESVRQHPGIQRRLALALYRSGESEAALEHLDRLVGPDDGREDESGGESVRFFRALLLAESGERERAADELALLWEENRGDVDFAVALVRLLLQQGESERAESVADEILGTVEASGDPEALQEARLDLAALFSGAERFERAIPMLERVVEEEPQSVRGQFLLASAYERSGRDEEAEVVFEELITQEPEFHLALNYLGYMWAEEGENLDRALELVKRAVELEPQNGAYVDSLGWVYYQLGRYDDAVRSLERAAELEPSDSTVHEHLGDAYRALGRNGKARAAYRRALELDGDEATVREKLRSLDESP